MTAAIFLTSVGLLALYFVTAGASAPMRRRIAVGLACLAALPLAFGPMVPISHFIFEATGRSMLWGVQAVAALLLGAIVWQLVGRWRSVERQRSDVPVAGVLVCHAIWIVSSVLLSDHESGPTPDVWDAPIYVVDWLAAVAACVFLAFAAWRIPRSGAIFRSIIGAYLILIGLMIYATVT